MFFFSSDPNLSSYSFGQKKRPAFISDFDLYIESATQSQIIELYNKSSIFISTSREEGFGLTGLESMACRCALVSTKTNCIKDDANSENAILCDIDDIDDIYNALVDLLNDNDKRISIAKKGNLNCSDI